MLVVELIFYFKYFYIFLLEVRKNRRKQLFYYYLTISISFYWYLARTDCDAGHLIHSYFSYYFGYIFIARQPIILFLKNQIYFY